ncbi:MAG TPA: type VI secretion system ATPase TssH [Thermoanaerobaculia bacterium]|nr:type VI secretion system ATPase TssH [Thermoanaerobaculia bacterium]
MSSELKVLIGKLNPVCRRALEMAAAATLAQTHYNVEVEHLLLKLLELPATDLHPVLRTYGVATAELTRQLTQALESFDRGNSRTPAFSPQLVALLREGYLEATLALDSPVVRSGALLAALFERDALRGPIFESCPALAKIPRSMIEHLPELIRDSTESTAAAQRPTGEPRGLAETAGTLRQAQGEPSESGPRDDSALGKYTLDLTAEARAGRIDPIRGRDAEIRQVIDILTRRRQNNPILVGDAGVGKTAVAEGFALKVAAGEVPESLARISVRTLDLGLLQAGAGIKGEFEERVKQVIGEVKAAARPVILFIDEAHTLIGAGAPAGQADAANLLKPALARGELRTIAATTWSEYKKYFEKDPALARRFQPVKVEEPDEATALDMLRGLVPSLERHHGVPILDVAVRDAVRLSHRYLSERRLPDKAISVLDTACARVALAQQGQPPELEDVLRQIRLDRAELEIRQREGTSGPGATPTEELEARLIELARERAALAERWERERQAVGAVRRAEAELAAARAAGGGEAALDAPAARLAAAREAHAEVGGPEPMVPLAVDSRSVAAVISGWTGIPAGRMLADEVRSVLTLPERLAGRIVGQPQALTAISRRIATSRAGLEDPGKPKGVFLLVGPTGVGKTETALALADLLYGGERNMVVLNMSEFQEAHSVATLKGAPPGYVGYGKGGVLTEAVRRKPWCVVLLDEVEKAHPDVVELFYQVFDKGVLEDGEGVPVDFKNTVILLTSNAGAEGIQEACRESPEGRPDPEAVLERIRPALLRHFRPALLGRLVVVPYYPLGKAEVLAIVDLKLRQVKRRLRENHGAELTWDDRLVASLAERCRVEESGARNIDHLLTQTLLPELSARILARMAKGEGFQKVHVSVDEMGRFV